MGAIGRVRIGLALDWAAQCSCWRQLAEADDESQQPHDDQQGDDNPPDEQALFSQWFLMRSARAMTSGEAAVAAFERSRDP